MNELVTANRQQLAVIEPAIAKLLQSPNDGKSVSIIRSVIDHLPQANGTGPIQLAALLEELPAGETIVEKITITITQKD